MAFHFLLLGNKEFQLFLHLTQSNRIEILGRGDFSHDVLLAIFINFNSNLFLAYGSRISRDHGAVIESVVDANANRDASDACADDRE
jgi:hypothetical protein